MQQILKSLHLLFLDHKMGILEIVFQYHSNVKYFRKESYFQIRTVLLYAKSEPHLVFLHIKHKTEEKNKPKT